MADRFDRVGDEGSSGVGFVMGLLTGTVLGAGLGILFAPRAGADLRSQLSEQAGTLANTAAEGYRKATESAGQWAEKGRDAGADLAEKGKDLYGKAREAVQSGADDAYRSVRDAARDVAGTASVSSSSAGSPSGHDRAGGKPSGSGGGPQRS